MSVKPVLVHSCHVKKNGCPREMVISGDAYIGSLGVAINEQEWYLPLPKSCRCRRYVSVAEATEFVGDGRAVWVLKFKRKRGEVILNDEVISTIWMPVERERVPRVDLITKADVERSYCCNCERPEGLKGFWKKTHKKNCSGRRYAQYIEEIHQLFIDNRVRLMKPFRPDPFDCPPSKDPEYKDLKEKDLAGRTLFMFGPDMKTAGGYAKK